MGVSPLDLSLPLTCTKVHQARTERKLPPWSLVEPASPLPIYNEYGQLVDHVRHTNESIALTTVFNYVVATHGSERLPLRLTALGAGERWEILTPAIFGVSAEEFERGWRLFLVEHYDVPRSW